MAMLRKILVVLFILWTCKIIAVNVWAAQDRQKQNQWIRAVEQCRGDETCVQAAGEARLK